MVRFYSTIAGFALYTLASAPSFAAKINAPQAEPANNTVARGVLQAKQKAVITAGMSGQLVEAPYKAGRFFKQGTLLAKFDCALEEAQLAALSKAHQTYSLKYKNVTELYQYGAAGKLNLELSESEMQQVYAEVNIVKTRLKYCAVYAPFSGYVTAQHASAYESPQKGQDLYTIEKAGSLELSVIVPSNWIRWLRTGHSLDFTIDETGDVIQAKVIRIGATIDPVSQTLEIIAKPSLTSPSLSGMSGYARFKPPS